MILTFKPGAALDYDSKEYCPHCDSMIPVIINGFNDMTAICPVCGKTLVLCSFCDGSKDGSGYCNWDSDTESCYMIEKAKQEKEKWGIDEMEQSTYDHIESKSDAAAFKAIDGLRKQINQLEKAQNSLIENEPEEAGAVIKYSDQLLYLYGELEEAEKYGK